MGQEFEIRWEGELPASPRDVWDGITRHADGYMWKVEYEPRVGGAERGLSAGGGTVTAWDPPRHFATSTRPETERDGHNELDYRLEPLGSATYLRYVHRGVFPAGEDQGSLLETCRQHTAFYQHSLGQYACHFAGREATCVTVDGPESATRGAFVAVRRALGLADDVVAGDRVRLTPAGLDPIDGVVDYAADAFLGVRSADALYRVYGRDTWGLPVSVAHHFFADDADEAALELAWTEWMAAQLPVRAAAPA